MKKDYGNEEYWSKLSIHAHNSDKTLKSVLLSAFNIIDFNILDVLKRFNTFENYDLWLIWIWYHTISSNMDDYASDVLSKCDRPDKIISSLLEKILDYKDHPKYYDYCVERIEILNVLKTYQLSNEFISHVNNLSPADALMLLSANTDVEKTSFVKIASKILVSTEPSEDIIDQIYYKYPELSVYLKNNNEIPDETTKTYFANYKKSKIVDTFPPHFLLPDLSIDGYEKRGQILHRLKTSIDPYFIWIDGMGVEWIDLLIWEILKINPDITVNVDIASAVVPTVTSVNMDHADKETISEAKINDLDKLSHLKDNTHLDYQYLIVKQFNLIKNIAANIVKKILSLNGKKIVVTADHGMSRFAALGFHKIPGKDTKGLEVYNNGRYGKLHHGEKIPNNVKIYHNEPFVAFRTYDHFRVGGHAPGEIHGGATPEEALVPIITFTIPTTIKNTEELICDLENNNVFSNSGIVTLDFKSSKNVTKVIIELNGALHIAEPNGEDRWRLTIEELIINHQYEMKIHPNGKNLGIIRRFTVIPQGFSQNDIGI